MMSAKQAIIYARLEIAKSLTKIACWIELASIGSKEGAYTQTDFYFKTFFQKTILLLQISHCKTNIKLN